MKTKLEYIWLDGIQPTQSLRSKTRVERDFGGTLEECPMWNFDGSSTAQAEGNASDLLLKPVAIFPDPCRSDAYLVMTEVMNADGTGVVVLPLSGFRYTLGDRAPVWMPDGDALVYVTADGDSSNLAVMWVDGSGRTLFVFRFGDDSSPSLGPAVAP